MRALWYMFSHPTMLFGHFSDSRRPAGRKFVLANCTTMPVMPADIVKELDGKNPIARRTASRSVSTNVIAIGQAFKANGKKIDRMSSRRVLGIKTFGSLSAISMQKIIQCGK